MQRIPVRGHPHFHSDLHEQFLLRRSAVRDEVEKQRFQKRLSMNQMAGKRPETLTIPV
jgi:hypothetical protein